MQTTAQTPIVSALSEISMPGSHIWLMGNNCEATCQGTTNSGNFAALTDKGRGLKYPINQDAVLVVKNEDRTILVSIDGMGGHGAGEIASNAIAQSFALDLVAGLTIPEAVDVAKLSLAGFNKGSILEGDTTKSNMGATFCGFEAYAEQGVFYHSGDTKGILIRGNEIIHETKDHSITQRKVDNEELTREQALRDFQRHQVTSSCSIYRGAPWEGEVCITPVKLTAGDIVLLGSDGLWDLFLPERAVEIISGDSNLEKKLQSLRAAVAIEAESRRFDDNINLIVYQHIGIGR